MTTEMTYRGRITPITTDLDGVDHSTEVLARAILHATGDMYTPVAVSRDDDAGQARNCEAWMATLIKDVLPRFTRLAGEPGSRPLVRAYGMTRGYFPVQDSSLDCDLTKHLVLETPARHPLDLTRGQGLSALSIMYSREDALDMVLRGRPRRPEDALLQAQRVESSSLLEVMEHLVRAVEYNNCNPCLPLVFVDDNMDPFPGSTDVLGVN